MLGVSLPVRAPVVAVVFSGSSRVLFFPLSFASWVERCFSNEERRWFNTTIPNVSKGKLGNAAYSRGVCQLVLPLVDLEDSLLDNGARSRS